MMKQIMKFSGGFFLLIALTFGMFSCNTEEDPNTTCTGCSSSSPWSKAGTGNCYPTQADCESTEGTGCVICN